VESARWRTVVVRYPYNGSSTLVTQCVPADSSKRSLCSASRAWVKTPVFWNDFRSPDSGYNTLHCMDYFLKSAAFAIALRCLER